MRSGGYHIRFALWLLTAFLLVQMASPSLAAFKYLREGMTAPPVSGTDLVTNSPVRSDDWLGKDVIVIVFWASWSARSIDQLGDLATFINEHPDLNCRVLAVNVDGQDLTAPEMDKVSEIITNLAPPFPVIQDNNLELFYRYGVIAVPSTAIIDTEGALRYAPSGYSLTTRDRIEDSIKVLLGLAAPIDDLMVDPGYTPTKQASRYSGMAINQIRRKQFKRALKNLVLAENADAGFAQPHALRGEVYLALDSILPAIESFKRAVALDSGSVSAWAGLGASYLKNNELDSALSTLAVARSLDDAYTPAMFSLGLCLAGRGELSAAIDSLKAARDLNARDPLTHYYLGKIHLQAGNTAEAVSAYQTSLELLFPAK